MPKKTPPSTHNSQLATHNSSYWADVHARKIIEERGSKNIVASGVSPSGPYHIGSFREVLTADTLKKGLINNGAKASHFHFVDDFDPLRKLYPFMPAEYSDYVGRPLYLVPDPDGCHNSYADHYFEIFENEAKQLHVKLDRVFVAHLEYQKGRFVPYIELAIEKQKEISVILKDVAGRELQDEGPLLQILCSECKRITKTEFLGWSKVNKTISYRCECKNTDVANYAEGEVKLTWRLDWPARWHAFGVTAEPFGRDHAAKGSSYDTGKALVEGIFDGLAPYPVPYEFINLKGDTKKISASGDNALTATEVGSIMPHEILRFFILRSRPEKALFFDSGLGLFNLIEEFSKIESAINAGEVHEFGDAYSYSKVAKGEEVISSVPFSHLVTAYQAASGHEENVFEVLIRTGYAKNVKEQKELIRRELGFIKFWLAKFAPEEIKFSVKPKPPKFTPNPDEKKFLHLLRTALGKGTVLAEQVHGAIYDSAKSADLEPKKAFEVLYRIFLGQDSGPRLGYFLSSLGKDFVSDRLSAY